MLLQYLLGLVILLIGIVGLVMGIKFIMLPRGVWKRNHELTKAMKTGYVDSPHVEDVLVWTNSGLEVKQQIKKSSLLE